MNRMLVLAVTILAVAPALAQDKPAAKSPTALITLEKGGQITLEFFSAFFWVWTTFAICVTGALAFLLSVHGLVSLRRGDTRG